jgi:cytochrome P450
LDQVKIADLARSQFKANPYPFYARLRAEAPVCPTTLLLKRTWLVTRYDDALVVLKDERFVKDWPAATWWFHRVSGPITQHMLNQDGADHTRLRTLVHKAFTPHLIDRLRGRIQMVCDDLLTAAAVDGRFDIMSGYALPLPLTIIAELLGIPPRDRLRFHSLIRSSLSASTFYGIVRALPDHWLLIRRLRKLIAKRRAAPSDDLITALIKAEEAGDRLSEPELVGMIFLLLIAGYETTVNLIGNGILALIQDPQQREILQQQPRFSESAVEELLRLTSPLEMSSPRFAKVDLDIGSARVRRGDLVVAVLGSANHDEAQFRNPDSLDIRRQPNKHLAFGQGAHFCVGAPLARLEGQIALTSVFRHFPNLRLAQPLKSLRWRKSLIIRGLEELPVEN